MAKRNLRSEAEDHVRKVFLPAQYGAKFGRERLRLKTGGIFDFDAVSHDEKIVCCISTSVGETSGGNKAMAKLSKMKADILSLYLLEGEKKLVMAFTDSNMARLLEFERDAGRIPKEIDIVVSPLPEDIFKGLYDAPADPIL